MIHVDSSEVWDLAGDLAAAPAKVSAEAVTVIADVASDAVKNAQRFAPVLTGTLRESINSETFGLLARIYANARYAGYVEYGTSDTPAQPFMRPAVELATEQLADGLGDAGEDIL